MAEVNKIVAEVEHTLVRKFVTAFRFFILTLLLQFSPWTSLSATRLGRAMMMMRKTVITSA